MKKNTPPEYSTTTTPPIQKQPPHPSIEGIWGHRAMPCDKILYPTDFPEISPETMALDVLKWNKIVSKRHEPTPSISEHHVAGRDVADHLAVPVKPRGLGLCRSLFKSPFETIQLLHHDQIHQIHEMFNWTLDPESQRGFADWLACIPWLPRNGMLSICQFIFGRILSRFALQLELSWYQNICNPRRFPTIGPCHIVGWTWPKLLIIIKEMQFLRWKETKTP